MTKFLVASLILTFTHHSLAVAPPVITNTTAKKEVVLGADATKALKKWNSGFQIFTIDAFPKAVVELFKDAPKELPMAAAGDFNGDGQEDIALVGYNSNNIFTVVLVAGATDYTVVMIDNRSYADPKTQSLTTETGEVQTGLSTYVSLLPAKDIKFKDPKKKLDAVQVETYNADTRAFYIKEGRAKEYKGVAL